MIALMLAHNAVVHISIEIALRDPFKQYAKVLAC